MLATVPAGAAAVGVRFRVGAAGAALGLPAAELLDATVPLEDVWGRDGERIADRVAAGDRRRRAARDARAGGRRADARGGEPDALVRAAAHRHRPERARASATASSGAASPTRSATARRRSQRVLRFQRFLALAARDAAPDLARLALEAGYADQAHLTRECSRLAGLPPAALLAAGAGPAGDRSVSFKTPRADAATMAA